MGDQDDAVGQTNNRCLMYRFPDSGKTYSVVKGTRTKHKYVIILLSPQALLHPLQGWQHRSANPSTHVVCALASIELESIQVEPRVQGEALPLHVEEGTCGHWFQQSVVFNLATGSTQTC